MIDIPDMSEDMNDAQSRRHREWFQHGAARRAKQVEARRQDET